MAKKKGKTIEKRLIKPVLIEYLESKGNLNPEIQINLINESSGQHRFTFKHEGEGFNFEVYFKKDGTTTFFNQNCKGTIVDEIIAYIEEKCLYTHTSNTYTLDKIDEEEYGIMIEFLVQECDAEILNDTPTTDYQSHFVKLKSPDFDELAITRFKTSKLLVQGKPLFLYHQLLNLLSEFDLGNLSQMANVQIDPEVITNDLRILAPNLASKGPSKVKDMLKVPLALQKIDIDCNDYNYVVFNAFRALEGHLKTVLLNQGIEIGSDYSIDCFVPIDASKTTYGFKEQYKGIINNNDIELLLEETYNYYRLRHELFHQNSMMSNIFIRTMPEAVEKTNQVLLLVDKYYGMI